MKVCKYKELSPMEHHGITYSNEYCTKNQCPCSCEEECADAELVDAHYRATNIEWDTSDDDVENNEDIVLPSEMDIPADIEDEDDISDYISNETGFCHYGFDLELVKD